VLCQLSYIAIRTGAAMRLLSLTAPHQFPEEGEKLFKERPFFRFGQTEWEKTAKERQGWNFVLDISCPRRLQFWPR
jgi:hypothetical protein